MRSRTRAYTLSSVGTIVGALLAFLYFARFMDVEDCKLGEVACTENFVTLPGIVFSWPAALAIVITLGALLGALVGLAISRVAERASPRNRALALFGVMVLLLVVVGVASDRYFSRASLNQGQTPLTGPGKVMGWLTPPGTASISLCPRSMTSLRITRG